MPPPLAPIVSWYPGHMASFVKQLPVLLQQVHVVVEVRDARMPLSSINPHFEKEIKTWQETRGHGIHALAERIVVYNKKDLVPGWGLQWFQRGCQEVLGYEPLFMTHKSKPLVQALHHRIVQACAPWKSSQSQADGFKVLVLGMPNVGKSTLLNALRASEISSQKAFQTSRNAGMTRAVSQKVKISNDPKIYTLDAPGVMIPFLGYDDFAKERGMRLALIAGLKEDLYDDRDLTAYLLYQLNRIQPDAPPYPPILGPSPSIKQSDEFLQVLADRLKARLPGGDLDTYKAGRWFVEWWRNALEKSANDGKVRSMGTPTFGWTLDFIWEDWRAAVESEEGSTRMADMGLGKKMAHVIQHHMKRLEESTLEESDTQRKKRLKEDEAQRRAEKRAGRAQAKYGAGD